MYAVYSHVFSFSFVHAPVCANCESDSCYIIQKKKQKNKKTKKKKQKKKKQKKKKKNDPYFGMSKNATKKKKKKKNPLSIFSLGKGGNPSSLTLFKTRNLVCFLPCPPAH